MRDRSGGAGLSGEQAAAADAGLKAMMPFGRPFLDHVLSGLADAGVVEAALVLGPEHEQVREYYRAIPTTRITVAFVEQARPLGTADAVAAASGWTAGESFIVLNADNLYPVDVLARLVDGTSPAVPAFARDSLGMPLDRVASFALMEAVDGKLARIVEKPGLEVMRAAGPDAMISMNVWRFDDRIFDACRDVPLSPRGERELPQAVQLAVSRGVPFDVIPVRASVIDLTRREDIPQVARALQDKEVRL